MEVKCSPVSNAILQGFCASTAVISMHVQKVKLSQRVLHCYLLRPQNNSVAQAES